MPSRIYGKETPSRFALGQDELSWLSERFEWLRPGSEVMIDLYSYSTDPVYTIIQIILVQTDRVGLKALRLLDSSDYEGRKDRLLDEAIAAGYITIEVFVEGVDTKKEHVVPHTMLRPIVDTRPKVQPEVIPGWAEAEELAKSMEASELDIGVTEALLPPRWAWAKPGKAVELWVEDTSGPTRTGEWRGGWRVLKLVVIPRSMSGRIAISFATNGTAPFRQRRNTLEKAIMDTDLMLTATVSYDLLDYSTEVQTSSFRQQADITKLRPPNADMVIPASDREAYESDFARELRERSERMQKLAKPAGPAPEEQAVDPRRFQLDIDEDD
jgi:hypothetical protein